MLKMKLLMRTAGEGEDDTAEDEDQPDQHIPRSVPSTVSDRLEDSSKQTGYHSGLDKETVFEWFGLHLNPAKRIEFMCGLLHMCQPLELRFLGSCLEDLARKDYHVLRDSEIRANNPNDLSTLSDVIDPVVRSKLLVYLSLLGSDSRECAGILFRILGHVDPVLFYKNYSVSHFRDPSQHHILHPCADGKAFQGTGHNCGVQMPMEAAVGPLEQLALLFTMASLHPAFPFHQRETVLQQLDKAELAIEERRKNQHRINAQHDKGQNADYKGRAAASTEPRLDERMQGQGQAHGTRQTAPSRRTQREAIHIENIVLTGISRIRADREYTFEVTWSDSSSSNVTKTHLELENFLLKLPKEHSTESFERGILRLLKQGDAYESTDVERNLKERFLLAPQAFRQTTNVCGFFLCESASIPSYSRCNPGTQVMPCSEASSQEEGVYLEPSVQGHRKKQGSRSPGHSIPKAKSSQGESSRRGPHSSEHNGLPDWRRKSSSMKPTQEACGRADAESCQGSERRSHHPATKSKQAALDLDRDKVNKVEERAVYLTNGSIVPPAFQRALRSTGKNASSSQDVDGDTSSESYSSPSSPNHHKPESLDSEDEKDKDTDSHSDDSSTQGQAEAFYTCQEVPSGAVPTMHPMVTSSHAAELPCTDTSPDYPLMSYMPPLPYMLPVDVLPDSKPAPGMIIQVPLALREPIPTPVPGDPEKREAPAALPIVLPGFGSPALGLHPPGSPALQPAVRRFKTTPSLESITTPPTLQPPVGAISVIAPAQPYASPLQPANGPLGEPSLVYAKPPGMALPSALPSPYPLAPTSVMATMGAGPGAGVSLATGQVQAVVAPAVPTHTPGPAPSPIPALTHSTAQSDSTSYINSTSCSSNPVAQQQQQKQQQQAGPQQQPICCGACGCRGGCAAATLASPQSNGQAQLPFFPPTPPPYAGQNLMHPHSHSEHVLGTQQGYSLQQMASPFSRFYPHMYPSGVGMVPGAGGALGGAVGVNKKNGNVSCYNCGVSGHYALDCKQPSIDSTQQGGFRLKYAASHSSDMLENAD
ncbi:hypothetical protein UPYG_G00070910 [Umbra pygmaea]|uniref:CCHC-type domain-containing protein n=1 Tax=Umbra pygmaea TaxID=75934 RepID=A0ABD0XC39_UMBPY